MKRSCQESELIVIVNHLRECGTWLNVLLKKQMQNDESALPEAVRVGSYGLSAVVMPLLVGFVP